jgi:hypothetical protein
MDLDYVSDVVQVLNEETINVLYVCTMPASKDSTFVEFFTDFQKVIHKYYPDKYQNVYFVSDLKDKGTEGLQFFEDKTKKLSLIERSDKTMMDYLEDSKATFDVIIFAQCTNLEQMFNLGKSKNSFFPPFSPKFLSSLSENGLLVNFYYDKNDKAAFADLEEFHSPVSFNTFLFHIFYQEILNAFFENMGKGIYQKKQVSDTEYKKILENAMNTIFKDIPNFILSEKKEGQTEKDIANDIAKTYFKETLNDSELEFLVREVTNMIKKLEPNKPSTSSKKVSTFTAKPKSGAQVTKSGMLSSSLRRL